MAFLRKSSKYLLTFKPEQFYKYKSSPRSSLYVRISSGSISSSHVSCRNFSICNTTRDATALFKSLNTKSPALVFNITNPRSLSTDSQTGEYFKDSFSASNTTDTFSNVSNEATDKVLFVDTSSEAVPSDIGSPMVDSSFDIVDIATSLSSDSTLVAEIVEPTLRSLGLAGWTPVGLVQRLLEFLHISGGMPWWLCIVAATLTARILMFPVFVKTQRNAIHLSNHMPQLQFLQAKFSEARRTGNSFEAAKSGNEIMRFMQVHDLNPLRNTLLPLLQAPVFISFFLGLRGMAKLPVESMTNGGFLWITDLTIPDPYYVMPFVASATLFVILKVGAESGMRMENMKIAKYFLGAIPFIVFPFCMNFPSAVLFYWCTSNFMTLGLVLMMKIEALRFKLNIPKRMPIDPTFVKPKKGFVAGIKESMEDQKVLTALDDRNRMDEIRFKKAGTGPIPRTYAYDPTKPRPVSAAAMAAKRAQSNKP